MLASNEELKELFRCHLCDCETRRCGICFWQGQICLECFCTTNFSHRQYDPSRPGQHDTRGIPPTATPRPVTHPRMSEIQTEGNGDCLYESIAKALVLDRHIHVAAVSPQSLRLFVSKCQKPEHFAAYKVTYADALKRVHTLRGFKNSIQLCGKDVGPENCIWGDENTIHILSNQFQLRLVVFDQRGQMIQKIEPESLASARTILLRLNRQLKNNEHFSLLAFNGQTLLEEQEWLWLKQKLFI